MKWTDHTVDYCLVIQNSEVLIPVTTCVNLENMQSEGRETTNVV